MGKLQTNFRQKQTEQCNESLGTWWTAKTNVTLASPLIHLYPDLSFLLLFWKQIQDTGSLYPYNYPYTEGYSLYSVNEDSQVQKKLNDSSKVSQAEFSKRSVLAAGPIRHVLAGIIKTSLSAQASGHSRLPLYFTATSDLRCSGIKTHRIWELSRKGDFLQSCQSGEEALHSQPCLFYRLVPMIRILQLPKESLPGSQPNRATRSTALSTAFTCSVLNTDCECLTLLDPLQICSITFHRCMALQIARSPAGEILLSRKLCGCHDYLTAPTVPAWLLGQSQVSGKPVPGLM